MRQFRILQAATPAVLALSLTGCGGDDHGGVTSHMPPPGETVHIPPPMGSTPEDHLASERFTRHQPQVLEQIGAHHAYARGLTGKGVTIGIEDSMVDYTQTGEFGDRVKLRASEGADLIYDRIYMSGGKIDMCLASRTCTQWEGDSEGNEEALGEWIRQIVSEDGWPTMSGSVLIHDTHDDSWYEVPALYDGNESHGTSVASTAAGTNLGVAPKASIVPIAYIGGDEYVIGKLLGAELLGLTPEDRQALDPQAATGVRDYYRHFDIINQSYGAPAGLIELSDYLDAVTQQVLMNDLPQMWRAFVQADRPKAERTILVRAAGNDGRVSPQAEAAWPYWVLELRGHTLAVVATDPSTQRIADITVNGGYNSSRCGSLPNDWDSAVHGPHYCLTAPGTVRGLIPNARSPGKGEVQDGALGTSFAAPVVSGALALMMEHFRGTRGNTAVVKRMLETADRTGEYADLETYGAGHLDLEAALSPVGSLNAGQERHALSDTRLSLPAAFGSLSPRMESLELAAFDEQDFPFWLPVSGLVSMKETGRSPIPELETPLRLKAPGAGLEALGLHWTPTSTRVPGDATTGPMLVAGFGPSSASLARVPTEDAWGYGLSFSDGEYLGGRAAGAFGSNLRSGMIWSSRSVRQEIGKDWSIEATGTLALSGPYYEENAIFEASPSMLSAASVRVGTRATGLTLEQPLRAESGTGTLRLENGELKNGQRRYDEHRVRLEPDAREIRATLRHEREAAGGSIAVQVVGAFNANHTTGQSWTGAGVAYRKTW